MNAVLTPIKAISSKSDRSDDCSWVVPEAIRYTCVLLVD